MLGVSLSLVAYPHDDHTDGVLVNRTQMIFQLAYYLTHSRPCGTYEAAQVRKYQLGRTETVRICTEETVAWTKAMVDASVATEEKVRLFGKAVGGHGSDMKAASNGMGIDRHLFGTSSSLLSRMRLTRPSS